MNNNIFGWSYPAGAENDPNAPWNQTDEYTEECPVCGNMNCDEQGNPLFDEDPSFCSSECLDTYIRIEEEKAKVK